MGPPYGKRDPYLLRDSYGNSMGQESHYWGSLKIPLMIPSTGAGAVATQDAGSHRGDLYPGSVETKK